jgi:ADP-heptose:LPS heptosyltransferase
VAIDIRGDLPNAWLLWLTGARHRIGRAAGGGGFLLTASADYVHGRPELQARRDLLRLAGALDDSSDTALRPRFEPSDAALRRADQRLRAAGFVSGTGPIVAVHLGAGTPAKRWPMGHWRALIGRLIVQRAARIVLIGTADERELARAALGDRPWPNVFDACGGTTIDELAGLLRRSDVMIGADSGPAHLAAAVGTPVVVLFSGAVHARQWRPPGEHVVVCRHAVECAPCHQKSCVRRGHPCMRELAPDGVFHAVREQLKVAVPSKTNLAESRDANPPSPVPSVSIPSKD